MITCLSAGREKYTYKYFHQVILQKKFKTEEKMKKVRVSEEKRERGREREREREKGGITKVSNVVKMRHNFSWK